MRLLSIIGVIIILAGLPFWHGCSATVAPTTFPGESSTTMVWPTTGTTTPSIIHDCFGPRRLPSGYDFHAGIDIDGNLGDPIYAVMSGEVVATDGYAITLKHASGTYTSYLHLSSVEVGSGETVNLGQEIGKMGDYGTTFAHLHFGYFVNLPSNTRNENCSRNPLEILPYSAAVTITATREGQCASIQLDKNNMIINRWELTGTGSTAAINYYDIVSQGSTLRNNQTQNSIFIDVTEPAGDTFTLTLEAGFVITDLKGYDFNDNLVIDR